MRHGVGVVGLGIIGMLALAGPAKAHGPCDCLSTKTAAPGTQVQIDESYNGVKVLWNPDPTELRNPALVGSRWERFHKPRQRTIELARQDVPGVLSFRVPDVPDGNYLVVIFDPSEGPDAHFTWETFEVTAGAALPVTGPSAILPLLVAAALLALGSAVLTTTDAAERLRHG